MPPAPRTISLGEPDNNRTLHASVGDTVTVTLHSTYWHIDGSTSSAVVAALAPATFAPLLSGCVPGQGCGTVSEWFTVRGDGRATLSATRSVCGEALRCQPAQGQYAVIVVVP